MIRETMKVGVVMERRETDNVWQDHEWHGVAVLPGAPETDPWREIERGDRWIRYHAATMEIEIFSKVTDGYKYNLTNEPPKVFVIFREDLESEHGLAPFIATVDPDEAQNYLGSEGSYVEAFDMPPVIEAWLNDFMKQHHVEQPFYKRQRKPYDPRKGGGPPPDGSA